MSRRKSGFPPANGIRVRIGLWTALTAVSSINGFGGAGTVSAQQEASAKAEHGGQRKAEVVLDRYFEALGGKAALGELRNRVSKGTLEFVGEGKKATFALYEAAPASMYFVMEFKDLGRFERGSDGTLCWENNPLTGPRIVTGPERDQLLQHSRFKRELHWRESYERAEWDGFAEIEGKACHRLLMRPKKGNSETWYFDMATYLLTRRDIKIVNQMGQVTVEGTVGDYKKVDGILVPHRLRENAMGMVQIMELLSVQHDVNLPQERFEPPAEVKALLKKP